MPPVPLSTNRGLNPHRQLSDSLVKDKREGSGTARRVNRRLIAVRATVNQTLRHLSFQGSLMFCFYFSGSHWTEEGDLKTGFPDLEDNQMSPQKRWIVELPISLSLRQRMSRKDTLQLLNSIGGSVFNVTGSSGNSEANQQSNTL